MSFSFLKWTVYIFNGNWIRRSPFFILHKTNSISQILFLFCRWNPNNLYMSNHSLAAQECLYNFNRFAKVPISFKCQTPNLLSLKGNLFPGLFFGYFWSFQTLSQFSLQINNKNIDWIANVLYTTRIKNIYIFLNVFYIFVALSIPFPI